MNLIEHQWPDAAKFIYINFFLLIQIKLYLLTNTRWNTGVLELKYTKAYIDYLQTIDDVYQNLEDYNQTKQ